MALSRRTFLQTVAAGGAAALIPWRALSAFFWTSPGVVPLFGTTLRGVGPGGIPVAAPDNFFAPVTGVTHYTMNIQNYSDPGVVPSLGATELWGYHPAQPLGGGIQPQRHLGGIIVAQRGVPIQVTFRNNLRVSRHLLPNDRTIMGAEGAVDRMSVHLHGGAVPWISDGGPYAWFDPRGNRGPSFLNNRVLNPLAAANEAEYYYPNNQSARFAWYHDHAMGITRLNAYAGVASAYLIRDAFELDLKNYGLPEFIEASVLAGKPIQELPLVVQDKKFVGPHIADTDPAWGHDLGLNTDPGSLWYQHTYDTSLYDLDDPQGGNLPGDQLEPSVVPEFFGDTMLVNGTAYPRVPVEPRRYRLRILNACNARFLNLQLYMADGSPDGITLDASGRPTAAPFVDGEQNRPAILQIGTEGGFLPKPVLVPTNMPFTPTSPVAGMLAAMSGRRPHGRGHRVPLQPRMLDTSLLLAPAERADLIVDFSKCGGKHVVLYNDAPSPFPMGDPIYDFFPGLNPGDNPANAVASPGFGPNTRVLMRFEVAPLASGRDVPLRINTRSNLQPGIDPLIVPVGVTQPPPGVRVRRLTLNEGFDEHGRLLQLLGTNVERPVGSNFYGLGYMERATEVVRAGATEVWEIYNLTGDVHPMHFHLVNAQLINRQIFDTFVAGVASFAGAPEGPELNERGWKETVKAYPSTVTRIALKFDVPGITKTPRPDQNGRMSAGGTVAVPSSPRTGGAEYVWHCHILEHEEHDMMRPLILT